MLIKKICRPIHVFQQPHRRGFFILAIFQTESTNAKKKQYLAVFVYFRFFNDAPGGLLIRLCNRLEFSRISGRLLNWFSGKNPLKAMCVLIQGSFKRLSFLVLLLALTGFRTILPCFQQVNLNWIRYPIDNQHLVSTWPRGGVDFKPAIWLRDTGQLILCFDRSQLIVT